MVCHISHHPRTRPPFEVCVRLVSIIACPYSGLRHPSKRLYTGCCTTASARLCSLSVETSAKQTRVGSCLHRCESSASECGSRCHTTPRYPTPCIRPRPRRAVEADDCVAWLHQRVGHLGRRNDQECLHDEIELSHTDLRGQKRSQTEANSTIENVSGSTRLPGTLNENFSRICESNVESSSALLGV